MRVRPIAEIEIKPPNGSPEPSPAALKNYLVNLAAAHNKLSGKVSDLSQDIHDDLVDLTDGMTALGQKIDRALAASDANATRMTLWQKIALAFWLTFIGLGGAAGSVLAIIKLGGAL